MDVMKNQTRFSITFFALVAMMASMAVKAVAEDAPQISALIKYHISTEDQHNKVDSFLRGSYVPALRRQGIPSIGVFEAHNKEKDGLSIWMLLSFNDITDYLSITERLVADGQFLDSSADYIYLENKDQRAFDRMEITLMSAFSGWPKTTSPTAEQKLFELRNYESFSEYKGFMKVAMFNEGEIDIFNKTGLHGVFFGGVIAGKEMPNLVYMLAFKDMEERDANWKKFINHPDWKEMSGLEQYKNTVSKIHQTFLVQKPYSKL
jgi:hypothetical protein